ncbi:hypothetical protein SAMN05216588_11231 [Pseudomonas flavescens]|uniref:Uncharacterized protein n=1 Tax=Phytopseudomonas flavescens TaxID=29435 RepID=A0A1G8IB53_9GAMM|nr:hypothetical protein [Pseudomonas flavescens]SDI16126.1 hypothetical protein SAMN05216588_11231 [Pseudomonas flavescens]
MSSTPATAQTASETTPPQYLRARLNARLQPLHRGELFEDPLDDALGRAALGRVSGGGTAQGEEGEVEWCDIEIAVNGDTADKVAPIIAELERLGAPNGSSLIIESERREVPFGTLEGLAIYLNGTELPDEVYADCDINVVYDELQRLIEGQGQIFSYWQGPTETALYLYGTSHDRMRESISDFLGNYPLCQRCRLERIA